MNIKKIVPYKAAIRSLVQQNKINMVDKWPTSDSRNRKTVFRRRNKTK